MDADAKENSLIISMTFPPAFVRAIDDFRFAQRIPSRSEAARRLIERGLEAIRSEGAVA